MTRFPNLEKLRRQHIAAKKKKPANQRAKLVAPTELVAENAGYIVWKDSKLVVFYTNNLASTPLYL
jgi:CDP-diacylglycerol pyrophosphatase